MDEYEDYTLISEIQYYAYCPRRWGMIILEKFWDDNLHTIKGTLAHQRCHDNNIVEKHSDKIISRDLSICSNQYKIYGKSDVVEFHKTQDEEKGTILYNESGYWKPIPIEYKQGKTKTVLPNLLQLTGQCLCLEEEFCCQIDYGYIYHISSKRREKIEITDEYRQQTSDIIKNIQYYKIKNAIPNSKYNSKRCRECSIIDICKPVKHKAIAPKDYIQQMIENI